MRLCSSERLADLLSREIRTKELHNTWKLHDPKYARANRLSAHLARAIYRETRGMNLPRAPLHGAKHKAKQIPQNVIGKQGGRCFTNWQAQQPAKKQTRAARACPHCGGSLAA